MLETIASSTEISALFTYGKRFNNSLISIIVQKSLFQHGHPGRVAFIAGKKNGNAVWRNRAKRRMRAIVRDLHGPWEDFDVVFIAKRSTTEENYSKVLQHTQLLLERGFEKSNL